MDNKNDPPIVREAPSSDPPEAQVRTDDLDISALDADEIGVRAALYDFAPRQPYRLAFFGEKTSLEDVLGPLAEELEIDLYLMGGQISDTHLHGMASRAVSDGRPLVVFTFSDFDPAGYWDMPTAIARKLQALRDLLFPTFRFTVVHAALGPEQVRSLGLPSSPLKDGETRAEKWLELYGSEQTEIDALATLQPEVLERIAREAVAPYFDAGLANRVQLAVNAWYRQTGAEVAGQVDDDRIDALKERARMLSASLRGSTTPLPISPRRSTAIEPPELPEADMDALENAQAERRSSVLVDSNMDFAEAVDRLHAHNGMIARREP